MPTYRLDVSWAWTSALEVRDSRRRCPTTRVFSFRTCSIGCAVRNLTCISPRIEEPILQERTGTCGVSRYTGEEIAPVPASDALPNPNRIKPNMSSGLRTWLNQRTEWSGMSLSRRCSRLNLAVDIGGNRKLNRQPAHDQFHLNQVLHGDLDVWITARHTPDRKSGQHEF